MLFKLQSAFEKLLQGDWSCTSPLKWTAASGLLLVPSLALATVSISGVSPYAKVNDVIYFSTSGVSVDTAAGFHAYDLTMTSNSDDLVYIDVSTTKLFTGLTTGQNAVVTLVVSDQAIPIVRAGELGAVADCSGSTNCQGFSGSLYYAAKYPVSSSGAGQTIRIGFYPKHICEETGTISGVCSGTSVQSPVSGDPTTISMKIYIGIEKADGDVGTISDSEEHGSVSLNFQAAAPQVGSCPAVSQFYFPGDGEISFNASAFSSTFTATSGAASIDTLIVLARDGATPGAIDSDGQINARVPSGSSSMIGGFTNTTTGADHQYVVEVLARDRSGAVSSACSAATYLVQSSTIQGLLAKSQCFIATAAFRSAKDPAVMLLRDFRDSVLGALPGGGTLIRFYYRWSPSAAQVVLDHPELRIPVLVILGPLQIWAWLALHAKWMVVIAVLGALLSFPRSLRSWSLVFLAGFVSLLIGTPAHANEDQEDSFIEQIRSESPALGTNQTESYIDQKKKRLGPPDQESLIEAIRQESGKSDEPEQGYSAKKKQELSPLVEQESAIQAVREGRSEVRARKADRQGNAFGLTVSVKQDRTVTAESSAVYRSYSSLYGTGYVPDFQFFYETQPLHGEWLGSIGLFGQFGFAWQSAYGTFEHTIPNPDGGSFSATSGTKFTFVTMPATVGGVYRFNLLRFARPYIKAGATVLGYAESRSDDKPTSWGNSRGYLVGAGVALPLDFLDSVASWSMYEAHGVRRNCLTVDYQRIETLSGSLDFTMTGFSLGLLFEL